MAKSHKQSIVIMLAAHIAAFLLAAGASFMARPAFWHVTRGLALYASNTEAQPVVVSGQRLECEPALAAGMMEVCALRLGSDTLVVSATRLEVETALERECAASFRNATPRCDHIMNHAQVPGFAYIDLTGLVTPQDLALLRQMHWVENLSEDVLTTIMIGFALSAGLIALYALLPVLWKVNPSKIVAVLIAIAVALAITWTTALASTVVIGVGYWD